VSSLAALPALDGLVLSEALRAGIYQLFSQTEHLNKINVFPVPDGDTGTNMAMTLASVLQAMNSNVPAHAGLLLTKVADAAIDGARGNSGAILSQFLTGVGDHGGHLAQFTASEFSAAVTAGAGYAREALTQPREGTLLTLLSTFALELEQRAPGAEGSDFRRLLPAVVQPLRAALERTRGQLEELRAANVVDAGAQGFVELVDGMARYFETGAVGEIPVVVHDDGETMAIGEAAAGEHRYCTECLVAGQGLDQRRIRETLGSYGSSLVVGGSQRKVRVHIHTDEPERVFECVRDFGVLSAEKADDMWKQQAAAHHARGRRVAVVTDSAADLPDSVLERFELHVVPLRVHFGARSYLDKVSISAEQFYREIAAGGEHPKTSQPPPGDFRRMYEFLASHFDAVVSVSLSAKVSGTFNAATIAAQRVKGERIEIVDSLNASLGQGLVAWAAAETAMNGGSRDEVVASARHAREHAMTYGLLARLDYLVRGGRVPRIVKTIADLLGVSIILINRPDGRVAPGAVLWGKKNLRSRFAKLICRRLRSDARYRMIIGHGSAEDAARELQREILALTNNVDATEIATLGPALGVHGGPGMLVVGVLELPGGLGATVS